MQSIHIEPWVAAGVLASTAANDAIYVFLDWRLRIDNVPRGSGSRCARTWRGALTSRQGAKEHPTRLASRSAATPVISFYVVFAATGSWIGAYAPITFLARRYLTSAELGQAAWQTLCGI
jgi:hypothetical protein